MLEEIANHLWQSTVFAVFIALIMFFLRNNSAKIRYWLWFSAVAKFFIPLSVFISLGGLMNWQANVTPEELNFPPAWISTTEVVLQPFAEPATQSTQLNNLQPASESGFIATIKNQLPLILAVVWLLGTILVLGRWINKWVRLNTIISNAPVNKSIKFSVPVKTAPVKIEPGIFGIFRPVLFLPEHLINHLSEKELHAILLHEQSHLDRKDNLTGAMYMLIAAIFWFHPLVWWIGLRLVEEREKACDEEVAQAMVDSKDYAEGILKVCQYCIAAPLVCVAGVSGADLKVRITNIMMKKQSEGLTMIKKTFLASLGAAVIAAPILLGMVNTPNAVAQEQVQVNGNEERFETADISIGEIETINKSLLLKPGGGLSITNWPVKGVISFAFGLQRTEVTGPEWLDTQALNIEARSAASATRAKTPQEGMELIRARLRTLLTEELGLITHVQNDKQTVYALTVQANGDQLEVAGPNDPGPQFGFPTKGVLIARGATMQDFINWLGTSADKPIVNQTGLTERYNLTLQWTVDPAATGRAAFSPSAEQIREGLSGIGLALVEKEESIDMLMVDNLNFPQDLEAKNQEIEINFGVFDRYVGHYEFPNDRLLTVFRQDDKLFSQISNQQPVEIFAESDHEFYAKDSSAKFVFSLNGNTGKADHVSFQSGAIKLTLKHLDPAVARERGEKLANQILEQLDAPQI